MDLENLLWIIGGVVAVVFSVFDGLKNYRELKEKPFGQNYVAYTLMFTEFAIVLFGTLSLLILFIRWLI